MPSTPRRFELPLDWSPEQARAVLDFLQMLQDQIWMLYHHDIQDYLRREQSAPDTSAPPGDPSQPPF
jgi:hypothetical protein